MGGSSRSRCTSIAGPLRVRPRCLLLLLDPTDYATDYACSVAPFWDQALEDRLLVRPVLVADDVVHGPAPGPPLELSDRLLGVLAVARPGHDADDQPVLGS